MKYYSICDTLAESWGPMFPANNDDVAFRQFNQLLSKIDDKTDFELYQVADFDDKEGQVTNSKKYKVDTKALLLHQEKKLNLTKGS